MNTGFETEAMSSEDISRFLSNVKISILREEPVQKSISCFNIAPDGMIAVGIDDSESKMIGVYDGDGIFQYGYSFRCNGLFGFEYDANNINIYFFRSDVAVALTPDGTVVDVRSIADTDENTLYWKNSIFTKNRVYNENVYSLRNTLGFLNLLMTSYSQLIKIDKAGHTKIIYDVSTAHNVRFVLFFIFIILFLCVAIGVIISEAVKYKKVNDHKT